MMVKPFDTLLERKYQESRALITVAVSCYKYGREGKEALESLLQQTEEVIDLVLVDDRSPDDSVDILLRWFGENDWTHKFANVQFIRHRENQGLTQTRNTALSLVVTPYVFILDADNQLYPRALRALREALENSQYAMAYSLLEKFGAEQGIINNSLWVPEKFGYGNYIDAMTLIRADILRDLGGYRVMPNKFGWEDYDLWCSFVDHGLKGCHVPQILCRYRVHNSSMLRTVTNAFVAEELARVREDFESHHTGRFYF
jgi:glycosyltransferase involved in cell wall biosynthesis